MCSLGQAPITFDTDTSTIILKEPDLIGGASRQWMISAFTTAFRMVLRTVDETTGELHLHDTLSQVTHGHRLNHAVLVNF